MASSQLPPRSQSVHSGSFQDSPFRIQSKTFSAVPRARRIRLYRNGDTYFSGVTQVIMPDHFRTFDALLAEINKSAVADPAILSKGVRYLFTVNGLLVKSLDDLVDGRGYVCASTKQFKPLDYDRINGPAWVTQFKATIKGLGEIGPDANPNVAKEFIVPRMIWVFRAGPRPRTHVRTLLNRRTARSFEQVLSDIGEQIHETGPIKSIFTLGGKQLRTLRDFFGDECVFIAFGSVKFSPEELELNSDENRFLKGKASTSCVLPGQRTLHQSKTSNDLCLANDSAGAKVSNGDGSPPYKLMAKYDFGKVLLQASSATIRQCEDRKNPEKSLVVKVIHKLQLTPEQKKHLTVEIDILRRLNHDNVVRLVADEEKSTALYHILEFNEGLDVLEFICGRNTYTEKDACSLLSQIFSGLQYLHSLNVVHRNINPSNILVETKSNGQWLVKVYDFGLATNANIELQEPCGTPAYMAPEMISGTGYGKKADIWSGGVVGYVLLCGFEPFTGASEEELFRKISACQLVFPSPCWDSISNLAKDLIVYMLEECPHVRSNASEVLDHPWIARNVAEIVNIRDMVVQNVSKMIKERERQQAEYKSTALSAIAATSLDKSNCYFDIFRPTVSAPDVSLSAAGNDSAACEFNLSSMHGGDRKTTVNSACSCSHFCTTFERDKRSSAKQDETQSAGHSGGVE